MSIENRVISLLQSAVRADVLPDGHELNSPYVIHAVDGCLLDCNEAFSDLVARSDLCGTHFSERCPTRFIEKEGNDQIRKAKEAGFARLRRPILGYDGRIHSISCELQIVALGGTALFLSSFVIEAFDIGKITNRSKGEVLFLASKSFPTH